LLLVRRAIEAAIAVAVLQMAAIVTLCQLELLRVMEAQRERIQVVLLPEALIQAMAAVMAARGVRMAVAARPVTQVTAVKVVMETVTRKLLASLVLVAAVVVDRLHVLVAPALQAVAVLEFLAKVVAAGHQL
jgi:hypothetical protein